MPTRDIDTIQRQLEHAIRERDAWKKTSSHHYAMAAKLVEALERELQAIQEKKIKPVD